MTVKKDNMAIVGVGAIACVAGCAGPILGFLAAIGFGTTAGFALFGTAAIVFGAVAIVVVLRRKRRRARTCAAISGSVAGELSTFQTQRS